MNCNTNTGNIIQNDTYHKRFEFLNPDNTPMDISVFDIFYGLKSGSKYYYEQDSLFDLGYNITGYDIDGNPVFGDVLSAINIEILPDITRTLPAQGFKEIIVFTLTSDPTEITTMYSGNVTASSR